MSTALKVIPFTENNDVTTFDFQQAKEWTLDNRTIPLYFVTAYCFIIYYGPRYMKNRPAVELRPYLIVWNAVLSVFSVLGVFGTVKEFVQTVKTVGLMESYCVRGSFFEGESGFWVWLFSVSKCAELGDTIFLILRKRPLKFLHWYHHISVVLDTWYIYPYSQSAFRWYCFMNYLVHSFMYTYYLLRSIPLSGLPGWVAPTITCMQISQMIIGCITTAHIYLRLQLWGENCDSTTPIATIQCLIYGSYLVLFVQFYRNAYGGKRKKID